MTQITSILTFSTDSHDYSPTLSNHGRRTPSTGLDNGNMNPDEERDDHKPHGK